jgi:hypothetical protein
MCPAGVLKASVDWEKLRKPAFAKDPRIPPPVLLQGSPQDLSHLSEDEAAFVNYCRFATDTKSFRDFLPVSSWGQCVLYQVQVPALLHADTHALPQCDALSGASWRCCFTQAMLRTPSPACTVQVILLFRCECHTIIC